MTVPNAKLNRAHRAATRRARWTLQPWLQVLEDRTLLSHLTYHGGPTLANPAVSAVYYGGTWASVPTQQAMRTKLNGFLATIVDSAYMDFLASFDPTAKNVGGRGTLATSETVATPLGATVEDHNQSGVANDPNDIVDMIQSQITANKIQESSLVFVYVAPGTVVHFHSQSSTGTLQDENSVDDFLGYHSAFTAADGKLVYYAVMAYPTAPNANLSSYGLTAFPDLTVVSSHELAEAVTDPNPDTGWYDDHPITAGQNEIGDLVANMADNPAPIDEGGGYDYGLLDGYVVQYEFANAYTPAGLTDNPVINGAVLPVEGFGLTGPALPPLAITQILNPTTGSFSGTIATFEDTRLAGSSPTQYTALIDWGDGTTSPGTIAYDSASKLYDVIGGHAYTQGQGTAFPVHVSIADNMGGAASLVNDVTLAPSAVGQLDPSFGYQGTVPETFAASDIISYPDGRLLVSGTGGNQNGYFPYVQRYTANGQLDPDFGSLGTAIDYTNAFAGNVGGLSVALEPDGKIVESGQYNLGPQLIRYNPDGSLDTSFGTNGVTAPLYLDVAGQSTALDAKYGTIAVLPDGRILLVGEVGGFIGLAMYRTDGTLDPTFNGNGTLLVTPDPGHVNGQDIFSGLAVENGKILVQISDDTADGAGIFLYRFNVDGTADTTFGSSGVINLDIPNGSPGVLDASLAVQQDGKIIIGHEQPTGNVNLPETVLRYNSDGSPDQSFGTGGSTTFGNNFNSAALPEFSYLALQPDGKIVITSFFYGGPAPFRTPFPELARLNSDGSVDATFGNSGIVNVALPQPNQTANPTFITVQPSGRILLEISYGDNGLREIVGAVGDPVVTFGSATSVSSNSGTSTAEYDVSETAGAASITLERGGDLSQTLSVPFSTDDSGGHSGVNYTSVSTIVTFAAGSETATVVIPILNDPNAWAPIDVPLRLGTPSGGAILGNVAIGDLHIVPVEGIVITPTLLSSVMQGGAGASFTVVLQSVPTSNVSVPLSISTTNPTAVLSVSTLVFTPADALTPQTVTVTASGGSGSSPAIATVSAGPATSTDPKYNGLPGASATVGVYPTATSPGSIEFAAANFTYDENAGTAKITLVRLGGSSGSVSVHFATSDGTYAAAGKYSPLSGSISFGAGVTSKTITITLLDPGHDFQGDQTVDLTLTNPTGGANLGVLPTATLTLHDTSQRIAGDPDPTFGTSGKSILADYQATSSAITRQPDGKLVIAGTGGTTSDGTNLVRVWRTDASGQPDLSFGQQGLALIPFPNFGQVKGVATTPDGRIIVVGNATRPAGGNEFALLRLNNDGSIDTSFGTNGLVTTSMSPGDDSPLSLFIEDDGSILVTGTVDTANDATTPFAFVQYGPDGSLDIGFGSGGVMVIPAASGAVSATLQQPDGKWLLIGGGGFDSSSGLPFDGFALRLNADFSPDSTFGINGAAPLTWGEFYESVALQPDGKILIGGGRAQDGGTNIGRLNANGSLDTTFGNGGSASVFINIPAGGEFGSTELLTSLFVQPNGKIVAIGGADDVGSVGGYYTAAARYLPDGTLDPTFGDGGSRWFSNGGDGTDYVEGAVALPNGDIVIANTSDGLPVLASILTAVPESVIQTTPTINWANPADIATGTPLSAPQLDATASVPGVFTYNPAAGTILSAGANQALGVTFTPTDTTHYTAATDTVHINVTNANQITPTINWANPADITTGTPLSATQLDATASVPGVFTYNPAAGTVLSAGANQPLGVTFTPTDTAHYTAATDTVHINVTNANQTTPTINWANPADITTGTPLSATQLDATASVPGVFTYNPAAGTVLSAGANQPLVVTFTPTDTAHYTTATNIVHINVTNANQTTPTINWANPADITTGTPLSATQLDATASVPGVFTYIPAGGTVLSIGGGQTLAVTFTPFDTTRYTAATATVLINVDPPIINKTAPTINWADPADIVAGTPLSANQLDATASVPGVFTYTPAEGTVLNVGGGQTLAVTFTPFDTTHYTAATADAHINVHPQEPAPPTPPHVTKVVSVTHTKKGLTAITVGFDEAMDPASVANRALYSVLGAVTKHRKTVYTKSVGGIKGITFDGNSQVTINLVKPYKGVVQVAVQGGIKAANGAASSVNFMAVVK